MKKLFLVVFITILMTAGMILAGCPAEECPGSGDCTVTIKQDAYGLSIDNNSPRSTCGHGRTWDSNSNKYIGGCNVQNNIDNYDRTYGVHSCDCNNKGFF